MTALLLLSIVLFHAFILTRLIFFPYPELFVYPYLTNQGLVPYREILDQHLPGLMFFPINLNNLGMTTPEVARLWLVGIVVATHFLLFWVGKNIFKSNLIALLANILYLVWQPFFEGYTLWIDSFMPLFLLPSFYFSWRYLKTLRGWAAFLSGLFLGIALLFKQVVLPLIILVAIVFWIKAKSIKSVAWFIGGITPSVLLLFIWVISKNILSDFWYWAVTFNISVFAQYGRKLPEFSHIVRAGFVFGAASIMWIISWWRGKKILQNPLFLVGIFMISSFAFAATRFDFIHLQPALPFMAILTASSILLVARVGWGKAAIAGYIIVIILWQPIFYKGHLESKIFFFDEQMQRVAERVKSLTNPGDSIFVFGIYPHLYQMTDTLPPGRVFVFQFSWFIKAAGPRILAGLENDPPKIIVVDRTSEVDKQKMVDYMSTILAWIDSHYETIESIGTVEFMLPKGSSLASARDKL